MTLNSDSKNADCIHPASVWDALQLLDPFSEMLAEQAAPLIGIAYPLNLNVAELGDSDFVPHISHGTGRTFLLGDVMTEAAKRRGLPPPQFPSLVATTLQAAKATLKKRVGSSPPDWHDDSRHRSNQHSPSAAAKRKPSLPKLSPRAASGSMMGVLVDSLIASKQAKPKKAANRPLAQASGVYRVQGANVLVNIAKFSSLGDFLQNALLDDEWIFAIPPKGLGRPYDFLESLLAGDTDVPWKVMTYRDYLRAMLDAAEEDEAVLVAEAEASLFAEESSSKKS